MHGNITPAPDGSDHVPVFIHNGCLLDIQEDVFPFFFAVFIEPARGLLAHRHIIGIAADISECMIFGIVGMRILFPFGKVEVGFPDRLLCVGCPQNHFTNGFVCKQIVFPQIFGPEQIGDIVGHKPEHVVHVFIARAAFGQFLLGPVAVGSVVR